MLFTLQRYEFLSKSQQKAILCHTIKDVVYLTKVRIFKQITTALGMHKGVSGMLFTLQRYEFLSKSQQGEDKTEIQGDVVYLTKVRIFKQITTIRYA